MRFLFVGRMAYNKGVDVLLRAIQACNAQGLGERSRFDLVGDGPLRAELEATADPANTTFHGSIGDDALWRLYEQAHALVLPTLFEGMPTVILEAMARGVPAITTDVGATRELVTPETGILVPKRDAQALARVLAEFMDGPPVRWARLSAAAHAHVHAGFTWEHVASQFADLFRELAYERTR